MDAEDRAVDQGALIRLVSILHAIVLGITQGLTEFLPISSSGHLQLVPWLLGWEDFVDAPQLEQTFDVALHLGTLVGAIAYFRRDIARYVRAAFTRPSSTDGRLAWLLLASAVPAAIIGALFEDTFADIAEREWVIGVMLVVFGLVLLWADRQRGARQIDDFQPTDAGVAGLAQAMAFIPGVSRSGASITAIRQLGFTRDAAARLAFLMSLPITGGVVLKKGFDVARDFPPGFGGPFFWGILASGITGWLAVWGTIRFLRTHTFTPFVVYRVVAGAAVILLVVTGAR